VVKIALREDWVNNLFMRGLGSGPTRASLDPLDV